MRSYKRNFNAHEGIRQKYIARLRAIRWVVVNPDPDPDPNPNPDPGVLQTTNVAATAVGPLIIGVAHDAGASYSAILRSIAATTALVGVVCCLGLRTPQRRAAPPSSPSVSHSQELSESVESW